MANTGRHDGVQMTYKPLADRLQVVLYEASQVCYTNLEPHVKCATGVFATCRRYSCSNDWCNLVEAFGCVPASVTKCAWYCIRRR
ncbi:hypothetical protein B0H65DRAFT_508492 [Neurospora tetraspora]|uniref:Uncharacterized protein n=1 Tax=Neurospora tetraspora TaxID=94610 RepID=A0AAE0JE62_9PEZI|nr:hypothetical protein B0H65DRAFT_508492 [Neurospora tetraspora]